MKIVVKAWAPTKIRYGSTRTVPVQNGHRPTTDHIHLRPAELATLKSHMLIPQRIIPKITMHANRNDNGQSIE